MPRTAKIRLGWLAEPRRRKSAVVIWALLLGLLLVPLGGCGKTRTEPASEKQLILELVAAQVPFTRVTSLTFREGATHATVRVWTDAKTRQQTGMGEDCVAELEKINGRWFLMQVNNWRD